MKITDKKFHRGKTKKRNMDNAAAVNKLKATIILEENYFPPKTFLHNYHHSIMDKNLDGPQRPNKLGHKQPVWPLTTIFLSS